VAGKGEQIDAHGHHIDRHGTGRLGGIDQERNAVPSQRPADVTYRLDSANDVRSMVQHHQRSRRSQGGDHVCWVEQPGRRAPHHGKGQAAPLQRPQRAHDGIVLHAAHHDVVPWVEHPTQDEVERLRHVRAEHHAERVPHVEQAGDDFPCGIDHAARVQRTPVGGTTWVPADAGQVRDHCLHDPSGLGPRGRRIIEVVHPGLLRSARTGRASSPVVGTMPRARVGRAAPRA